MTEPVDLNVRELGHGPTIAFLHGLGGDHTVWNDVARRLEGEFRSLLIDLRGHGRSPLPPGSTLSFEEMEADLLRVLDQRSPSPVYLVGLSAGAFLALRTTRDQPGRVHGLVLVNGSAYCDNHTREILESWKQELREGGEDALALRLIKDLYLREWAEDHLDHLDEMRRRWRGSELEGLLLWTSQVESFDMRGKLSVIRAPTLILQGMSDVVVDPSHGRYLRQSIPGSELKIYRETGHLMPTERPEQTAEAIGGFVRAAEAQRALSQGRPGSARSS